MRIFLIIGASVPSSLPFFSQLQQVVAQPTLAFLNFKIHNRSTVSDWIDSARNHVATVNVVARVQLSFVGAR